MDALDVMMNIKNVIPHYQAIFSADSHYVIGYEVLARIKTDEGIKSLGPFFHDKSIPDDFKIELDDHLQNIALKQFLLSRPDKMLFLNVNANYIMHDVEEKFLKKLLLFKDQGLNFKNIVIEITEHDFNGDLQQLSHLLKYLQTLGMKVAIDDVGVGGSNLDRIGILKPDILKVDIHPLRNSELTSSYHGVIYSLALLARKVGADLLFEGIESQHQFHYSWRKNGRFYQGFFLSKPTEELVEPEILKGKIQKDIRHFIHFEREKIHAKFKLSSLLNQKIKDINKEGRKNLCLDEWILKVASRIHDMCFRIYITDLDGFQQTANGMKSKDKWVLEHDVKGKNWSWRPYFIENIIRMNEEEKGILSDVYSDIVTGEQIRTFSYPISESLFLFIDIPHIYLYENEVLVW